MVGGSKSAKGGPNPRGVQIRGGSKSAVTPGKEEDEHALAVDGLRVGNLIAYSSSKMCFFGFTNLSLACSRCDFNSCSSTATLNQFTTLCLGGSFPLHLF